MFKFIVILVAATVLPATCLADKAVETPVVAQTLAAFEQEATAARQELRPDGVYSFISDEDRQRVEKGLEAMHKLLQDHAAEGELAKRDKLALITPRSNSMRCCCRTTTTV